MIELSRILSHLWQQLKTASSLSSNLTRAHHRQGATRKCYDGTAPQIHYRDERWDRDGHESHVYRLACDD